jgi:hypothetical protein
MVKTLFKEAIKMEKMTWAEMKQAFPDEWLLITDYELGENGLKTGVVLRHSKVEDDVFTPVDVPQDTFFLYTGESTFAGLRSHATHHHDF